MLINVSMPWLDTESASLLCSLLSGNMSVLEWGCGGSTVYFSRYMSVIEWGCGGSTIYFSRYMPVIE